jgi:hypothetical protein
LVSVVDASTVNKPVHVGSRYSPASSLGGGMGRHRCRQRTGNDQCQGDSTEENDATGDFVSIALGPLRECHGGYGDSKDDDADAGSVRHEE